MSGAVISSDHASEGVDNLPHLAGNPSAPRLFSAAEVESHNKEGANGEGGNDGGEISFWAVIDGYVCEASEFVSPKVHPGGRKKVRADKE